MLLQQPFTHLRDLNPHLTPLLESEKAPKLVLPRQAGPGHSLEAFISGVSSFAFQVCFQWWLLSLVLGKTLLAVYFVCPVHIKNKRSLPDCEAVCMFKLSKRMDVIRQQISLPRSRCKVHVGHQTLGSLKSQPLKLVLGNRSLDTALLCREQMRMQLLLLQTIYHNKSSVQKVSGVDSASGTVNCRMQCWKGVFMMILAVLCACSACCRGHGWHTYMTIWSACLFFTFQKCVTQCKYCSSSTYHHGDCHSHHPYRFHETYCKHAI